MNLKRSATTFTPEGRMCNVSWESGISFARLGVVFLLLLIANFSWRHAVSWLGWVAPADVNCSTAESAWWGFAGSRAGTASSDSTGEAESKGQVCCGYVWWSRFWWYGFSIGWNDWCLQEAFARWWWRLGSCGRTRTFDFCSRGGCFLGSQQCGASALGSHGWWAFYPGGQWVVPWDWLWECGSKDPATQGSSLRSWLGIHGGDYGKISGWQNHVWGSCSHGAWLEYRPHQVLELDQRKIQETDLRWASIARAGLGSIPVLCQVQASCGASSWISPDLSAGTGVWQLILYDSISSTWLGYNGGNQCGVFGLKWMV